MYSDLQGYTPKKIDFVLDESVKEKFPLELDFEELGEELDKEIKTTDDVIKFVGKNFIATFPTNDYVERKLDDFEIRNIREEYCVMQENEIPLRKQNLEETLELIKRMKKEAEDKYQSGLMEVASYAAQVKKGTKEMRLNSMETFCISLAGYYLTYTYNKSLRKFVLAKGYQIPDDRMQELWANDEKNREAMKKFFGLDFPAPEIDKDEDGEDEDNDNVDNNGNDLPFDND